MSPVSEGADSEPPAPGSDATRTGQHAGADLAPGTVLADRFRVEALLGIGGMGVVYRATDIALGVPVAIKVLRPEIAARPDAFERFRNELLLARQVSSPHVLRIHDIARDGARWLISMDLVEGRPLDRLLDERGSLPVDEALAIARQVALGLAAAHAQGVVHRDLKPSNVLVDAQGRAWVGDFGIARSLGSSGGLTHTGQVIGTPDYLSPEQARAETVDARSDLYALGLVLYEMLSGRLPFSGGTPAEAISQRLVATPAPIRQVRADVPAWVEHLLAKLLQTRPSRRFADADSVVRAIDAQHVARDLHPGAWTWAAIGGLVLLAALAIAWRFGSATPATVATPIAPVPTRLVVLPIESADAPMAPALVGATEWLRWQLADMPGLPVVDGDRIEQARAQVAMADDGTTVIAPEQLRPVLPATHLLRTRVTREGDAFVADVSVLVATVPDVSRRVRGESLPAVLTEAASVAMTMLDPAATLKTAVPPDDDALAAWGESLATLRRGRPAEAFAALAKLEAPTATVPGIALARAQAAQLSGRRDEALAAADAGLSTKPGPALAARLRFWRALAGEGGDAALAAETAATQRHPDDLDAQLRLATLQAQSGALPAAAATLQSLLARDGNDPRAWFLLGRTSIQRGDLRAAVDEQLVRALVLYKRGRNAHGEAESVNALGVGYSRLGQTAEAQAQFRDAVARRRVLGDRRGVASSLRNLAQLATVQGQFGEAQTQLEEARALFAEIGDDEGLDAVDNELGLLAEERGDFVAADAAYRRMLRSSEQAGDELGRADSLNNIGYAQYQLGDYAAAQVFWQQAAAIFAAEQDQNGQVRAGQNLGLLEIARGHWDKARKLLDASLKQAERQQMVEEAAVSRRNLAELELLQGHAAAAEAQLARAAALFAERDDQRGEIDVALLRVRLALLAGEHAGAQAALDALAPALADASNEQSAIAALLRAQVALARGESATAQAALAQARARAAASGVERWQLEAALLAETTPSIELRESIQRLGNVALLLELQARAMRQAWTAGDAAATVAEYRTALRLLELLGDYADAHALHALGAQALARTGDAAGAKTAASLAQATVRRAGKQEAAASPVAEPTDGQ